MFGTDVDFADAFYVAAQRERRTMQTSSPESAAIVAETQSQILSAVAELSAVQQELIRAKYRLAGTAKRETQVSIGKRHGLSIAKIKRLELSAIRQLQSRLSALCD